MKFNAIFSALALLVATTTLHAQQAKPRIWRINNNAIYVKGPDGQTCDHCYTDLQAAIDDVINVLPGDTLLVEASGTSYGDIEIERELVILGPGYFLNENPGVQWNNTSATIRSIDLLPGSDGTVLKGLRVADGYYSYIYINASNVKIERCYVEDNIDFENNTPRVLNNIAIRQNFVAGILDIPYYPGPVNNLVITNNYFGGRVKLASNYQGIAAYNVFDNTAGVDGFGNVTFSHNIFKQGTLKQNTNSISNVQYNLFNDSPAWLNGGNNILGYSMTGAFGNIGSIDGKLKPIPSCAPCAGKGMFSGPDPYRLSGPPDIPSFPAILSDPSVQKGGQTTVTITTRTNN